MKPVKPPRLRPGDLIGLVAPGSPPVSRDHLQAGVRYLERCGYRVRLGDHVESEHGYLAGTDAERASDLNRMFRDAEVRAIFAVRGGYGSPRLLPLLDYAAIRRSPKILVGYSDITALQMALWRKVRLVTFSGPMPAVDFVRKPHPFTEEQFWRVVTSRHRLGGLPAVTDAVWSTIRSGRSEGTLLGGNLAVLVSCLGTPYAPDFRRSLLVVEDIHERPYRVDRLMTQLRNAGVLGRLSGMGMGDFTDCGPARRGEAGLTLGQVLADAASWLKGPVVAGLPYGHGTCRWTLPWGLPVRLDADRRRFEILEGAVG